MKTYRQHLNDTLSEAMPERFKELLDELDGVPPRSSEPSERGEAEGSATEGGFGIRH